LGVGNTTSTPVQVTTDVVAIAAADFHLVGTP